MYTMLNKFMEEIMWQGWIDIAAGIWLFLSGLIPAIRTPASMIAAGVAVVIFGFWGSGTQKSWQSIVNGLVGVWLVLSGIWFNLAVPWNFIVFGALIIILAIWNVAEHTTPTHVTAR